MRILRVISSVNPRGGGPIEGIRQITPVLEEMGHETTLVSLDDASMPFVRDFPLPCHLLGEPNPRGYYYSSKLVPWLLANAHSHDAVIVHGLWQYSGLGTWRAMRRLQKPYHLFTHGMLDPWYKRTYPLKHLKKWLYWPWAEYRVLRDARRVFYTSEAEKRQAAQSFWLYRAEARVIPYGIASPPKASAADEKNFRDRLPDLPPGPYWLYLSRFHPKKGVPNLLRAYARLTAEVKDPLPPLVLAGPAEDGRYAEGLFTLAASLGLVNHTSREQHLLPAYQTVSNRHQGPLRVDQPTDPNGHVYWPGMLSGGEKWGAFRGAEVFILPSHQENFGIAVVEALASGRPVLISDQVNICAEIRREEVGLVEPDTVEGTADLLRRWYFLEPTARVAMTGRCEAAFRRCFGIENAAHCLIEHLSGRAE